MLLCPKHVLKSPRCNIFWAEVKNNSENHSPYLKSSVKKSIFVCFKQFAKFHTEKQLYTT